MIYFTGDIHGDPSRIINAYESGKIVDNDIVIILGDAGFNYYHNHKWGFKKDEKVKPCQSRFFVFEVITRRDLLIFLLIKK